MKTFNTVGPISLPYCPGTFCDNWDSLRPKYLTDKRTGHTIGRLMPRFSSCHDTAWDKGTSQRYTPVWGSLTNRLGYRNTHEASLRQRRSDWLEQLYAEED